MRTGESVRATKPYKRAKLVRTVASSGSRKALRRHSCNRFTKADNGSSVKLERLCGQCRTRPVG